MSFVLRSMALWIALLGLAGCKLVEERPKGTSPLEPLQTDPQRMTLEIFSAPAPLDDPRWEALWSEVHEQSLSPELRTRLAKDGLRAGVLGPRVPDALASLLNVTDTRISEEERTQVPLDGNPSVTMRLLQPMQDKRNELVVAPPRDELALLRNRGGEVVGKTYYKAEGRLAMFVHREGDGRVRIELAPELHHGEPKSRTKSSDGRFIMTTERDKEVFPELKFDATLAAGEMLLVTSLPGALGSLGQHLFERSESEQPLRMLWAVRVAQSGADRAFVDWDADQLHPPVVEPAVP